LIDTNVLELVLDYRETDLEDPSSTAIPFARHAQAVAGEKRLKGITDCQPLAKAKTKTP